MHKSFSEEADINYERPAFSKGSVHAQGQKLNTPAAVSAQLLECRRFCCPESARVKAVYLYYPLRATIKFSSGSWTVLRRFVVDPMAATTMERNAAKVLPKRLVNTHTCRLVDFSENDPTPPYAILSHRWILGEEVNYQDYLESRPKTKKKLGYQKIRRACREARTDNFDYIWIDTICINQGNHDEVARNINGMYSFYKHSGVCYAYLTDVYKLNDGSADLIARMWRSGWFQRGWTLQELVAPRTVVFFSAGWEAIGCRRLLKFGISRLTGIPAAVLDGSRPIEDVDMKERMTWCAGRKTTRPPDLAYCLMGILGVSVTPDYSEDARTAFKRLQSALVQSYPDRFMEFKGDDIYIMLLSQNMRTRVQSSYSDSSTVTSVHYTTSSTSLDKDSLSPPKFALRRFTRLFYGVISTSASSNSLPANAASRETDNTRQFIPVSTDEP
ncbi:hypothetical protein D9758_012675 [Tetrapyrgos nigripes]|uniref:Heterokaryon incompatibility domain-containing protein n=1 Tax=Tetrapyrgos nigripes TaxID=182062 RepID=A0A8H5FU00_9AGAR|nr:hypothetical protein D9758_012675 [Tetrapyrgos nigripes]